MAYQMFLLLAVAAAKGAAEMMCEPDAYGEPPSSSSARPRLRKDIFCEYDREVQPQKEINVTIDIIVRRVKVVHRTMEMKVLATLQWKDRFLTWDPARYDDVKEIQLSSKDIWTPSIVTISTLPWIREGAEEGRVDQEGVWPAACSVTSDGAVSCASAMDLGGTCEVSHYFWPHLAAACGAFIGSDFRVFRDVGVLFGNDSVQTELLNYVPDNDWVLMEAEREYFPIENNTNALAFKFKLRTRGVIISTALIGPGAVLSLLLLGSFCLPIKSYARLGICCCSTLGTVLASSLMFENVEPHEGPKPVAVTFYSGLLILSATTILMLFLLNAVTPHTSKSMATPRWLYSFQTWLFNSQVGKIWLKAMLMAPLEQKFCQDIQLMPNALYMQRGRHPGHGNNKTENEEVPPEVDGASVLPTEAADQTRSSGPHLIWEFTASFFNRFMFGIFLIACGILFLNLVHGMAVYEEVDLDLF